MTDEEKKAIEDLVKEIAILKENANKIIDSKELLNYRETLFNLIKKQSKEIEEYKKQLDLDYVDKNFIRIDKIKAKIEPKLKELDEQINEEWKKYGNSKELQDMEDMYNFCQSLLEKE